MFELLTIKLHDTKFLIMMLTSVAAIATVITLAMPFLSPDTLEIGRVSCRERV